MRSNCVSGSLRRRTATSCSTPRVPLAFFNRHQDDVGHIPLHQHALAWGINKKTVAKVAQRPFNDVDLRTVIMK